MRCLYALLQMQTSEEVLLHGKKVGTAQPWHAFGSAMACHGIRLCMLWHTPYHAISYVVASRAMCHEKQWHMPWQA